jgi:outer membrane protein TolC
MSEYPCEKDDRLILSVSEGHWALRRAFAALDEAREKLATTEQELEQAREALREIRRKPSDTIVGRERIIDAALAKEHA